MCITTHIALAVYCNNVASCQCFCDYIVSYHMLESLEWKIGDFGKNSKIICQFYQPTDAFRISFNYSYMHLICQYFTFQLVQFNPLANVLATPSRMFPRMVARRICEIDSLASN